MDYGHHREQYWGNVGGHPYQHGAHGRHPSEQEYMRHRPQPQPHVSRQIQMEDAIVTARERVPGQVVEAELDRRRGKLVFEIDIITDQGVRYEVVVDADSGMILSVELD